MIYKKGFVFAKNNIFGTRKQKTYSPKMVKTYFIWQMVYLFELIFIVQTKGTDI